MGMQAIFNDGEGGRDEDELVEGAAGGYSGSDNSVSGKLLYLDDDLYTDSAVTKQHIANMSNAMNEAVSKLQRSGQVEKDKSTKKAIVRNVARINRISQQAILKALSLDWRNCGIL